MRIEDYAVVGDLHTAALVGLDGSVDWLCLPRFDSPACFAALVGSPEHGRFRIGPPASERVTTRRRYRPETLILETELETSTGAVRIVDFMPRRDPEPTLVRLVEGLRGEVKLELELVIRFGYGQVVPWVRQVYGALVAIAGPDALALRTPVKTHGKGLTTVAEFTVRAGETVPFVLSWFRSYDQRPEPIDWEAALDETQRDWTQWSGRCACAGPWRDAVVRSLITLKALTYAPSGGMVAAVTTSLPEARGGQRNWDYRYCWLRDATSTLFALMAGGYEEEAEAWRDWLLRAVAGDPARLQIMYGLGGERSLPEVSLPWLPGYEGALPVRVGNAAATQLQLDVFGEVTDVLYHSHRLGLEPDPFAWRLQGALLDFLEGHWRAPDEGIWEVRGGRQQFTHSKVLCWVAFDRAVKAVERLGLPGPVERWRGLRDEIHADVCTRAFDAGRGAFVQSYGSSRLDASTLLMPMVGFLPATDPRIAGTIRAVERELCEQGFVRRYVADEKSGDGLHPGEGAFLACSFWLADAYALAGRADDAKALFERLLSIRNDVGLLAEEYDPVARRQLGNFPQAFSHIGLINTAMSLVPAPPSPSGERAHH